MSIQSGKATREEMRALAEVCRRIKNKYQAKGERRFDWPDLFNGKMGLGVGDSYENNLRRGAAGAEKVQAITAWIIANELEFAARIAPELFNRSQVTTWQGFLNERGRYDGLRIRPYASGGSFSLHEISARHPLSDTRIRLGQEFYFEVESPIAGSTLALDHYKGQWYPIPLREDGSFTPIPLEAGMQVFPINDHGAVIPMRQRSHAGEHGHCLLIGPHDLMHYYGSVFESGTPVPLDRLETMAKRLEPVPEARLAMLLENVLFE